MRLTQLLFIALLFCYFTSCQKQVGWTIDPLTGNVQGDTTPHSGNPSGDLLVKIVGVTGAETITTTFTYDSSKHLLTEYALGSGGGFAIDSYKKYYRDSSGRIYKIAQLVKQAGIPVDTSFTQVYYDDPDSKNFLYTVQEVSVMGIGTRDSSVYTFDGNGNMGLQKSYVSSALLGGAPELTNQWEYTYAGGNLVSQKVLTGNNTGALKLIATYKFTYDNRSNPMILNGEAFLTGRIESASKNNLTKLEIIDAENTSNNFTITTSLLYGSSNKPATVSATLMPSGQVTNYTFYYQ